MPFSVGSQVAPPFISDEKLHRREIARWMNDTAANVNSISASVSAINTSISTLNASVSAINTSVTNLTLSLSAVTTNVTSLMTGPAFSAYQNSAQSVLNVTFTKVNLQAEEFDTAAAFDSVTNFRFQPLVAGYYQITGNVLLSNVTGNDFLASIFKNGAEFKRGQQGNGSSTSYNGFQVTALIYLNGSTDYVEFFCHQGSGGAVNINASASYTYFQGHLARLP